MNKVTRSSKAYPGHIKISTDATDGKEKPYLGSRRGRGMPSAREPIDEFTPQGRNNYDKAFKQSTNSMLNNVKRVKKCPVGQLCEWYTERKQSHCLLHIDAKDCKK